MEGCQREGGPGIVVLHQERHWCRLPATDKAATVVKV